jgi:hypothetical protein
MYSTCTADLGYKSKKKNTDMSTTMNMVGMEKNNKIFHKSTGTSETMISSMVEKKLKIYSTCRCGTMIVVWKEKNKKIFHLQVRNLGTMIVIWKVGTRVLTAGDLHIKKGTLTKACCRFPTPYILLLGEGREEATGGIHRAVSPVEGTVSRVHCVNPPWGIRIITGIFQQNTVLARLLDTIYVCITRRVPESVGGR